MIFTQAEIDQLFMDVSEVGIWTAKKTPPAVDVATNVDVIFLQPGTKIKQGDQEIIIDDPTAVCKSYQVSGIKKPDTLTIQTIVYGLVDVTSDGYGMTTITLGITVR